MKIITINEKKGYCFSEEEFKNFEVHESNGIKYYFLPYKFTRENPLDKQQVIELVKKYDSKKEIIKELNCNLVKLNNFLYNNYGTLVLERIRVLL